MSLVGPFLLLVHAVLSLERDAMKLDSVCHYKCLEGRKEVEHCLLREP